MTVIIRADTEMSDPGDAPVIPDITSGLLLDYTYDYLASTVTTDSPVTSITPTGGSLNLPMGTQVDTKGRPTLTSGPNNHYALGFNGDNAISTTSTSEVYNLISEDAPCTLAAVVWVANLTANTSDWARILAPARQVSSSVSYRSLGVRGPSSSFGLQTSKTGVTGNGYITSALTLGKWIGVVASINTDGTALVKTTEGQSGNLTGLQLGAMDGLRLGAPSGVNVQSQSMFSGKIARIALYNRALAASDIDALLSKYVSIYTLT